MSTSDVQAHTLYLNWRKPQKKVSQTSNLPQEKKKKGKQKDSNEVSLVVSGDGSSKEDATKSALRSAIEQAFGTFVSSNTQFLNDQLVKDEIVSISSGNIKQYKYISEDKQNDRYFVTLQAVVSINKLVAYTQAKGGETELAGASFAMDLKMKELNKKNEVRALEHFYRQLVQYMQYPIFDSSISVAEPRMDGGKVVCPFTITLKSNAHYTVVYKYIWDTFQALSLSSEEVIDYDSKNIPYYVVPIFTGNFSRYSSHIRNLSQYPNDTPPTIFKFRTRSDKSPRISIYSSELWVKLLRQCSELFQRSLYQYKIVDDMESYYINLNLKYFWDGYGEEYFRGTFKRGYINYIDLKEKMGAWGTKQSEGDFYSRRDKVGSFPVARGMTIQLKGEMYYSPEEISKIKKIKIIPQNTAYRIENGIKWIFGDGSYGD